MHPCGLDVVLGCSACCARRRLLLMRASDDDEGRLASINQPVSVLGQAACLM